MNSSHPISTLVLALLASLPVACATPTNGDHGSVGSAGSTSTAGTTSTGGGSSSSGGSGTDAGTAGQGSNGSAGAGAVPNRPASGSCGLDQPAFCEDFEHPSPGGRGGDLDETRWSFARYGHETRQFFVRIPASTQAMYYPNSLFPPTFCGQDFSKILPHNDISLCDGVGVDGKTSRQLNEVFDDQGDFAFNSMRIRQPFDFTGRTGTIVLDVDAKINPYEAGHGWWIEVFLADDPAPMPYHAAPGVVSYPKNGLGFVFAGLRNCPQGQFATDVSRVFVTKDHTILHDIPGWELQIDSDAAKCIKIADTKLNRLKITVSQDSAEIWGSDYDNALNLHRMAHVDGLELPFTKGYVQLQHSHYNAHKDGGVTPVQTYRWDNVGFDGPMLPVPRAYETSDNTQPDIDGAGGYEYGWYLSDQNWRKIPGLTGVDLTHATHAALNLSIFMPAGRTLEYRFNGGPTHSFVVPSFGSDTQNGTSGLRGFSFDVPMSELVQGDNVLEAMMSPGQTDPSEAIANVELEVQ